VAVQAQEQVQDEVIFVLKVKIKMASGSIAISALPKSE
jgi:hypothetical protein